VKIIKLLTTKRANRFIKVTSLLI